MMLFFCDYDLAAICCEMSVMCTFFSYSEGTGSDVPFYFASAFCVATKPTGKLTGPSTAPSAGVSTHESCLTSAPGGRATFSTVLPFGTDCGRSDCGRWLKRTAPFFFDMLNQLISLGALALLAAWSLCPFDDIVSACEDLLLSQKVGRTGENNPRGCAQSLFRDTVQ